MYMSKDQVQQVAETHADYLDDQLALGKISAEEHQKEMHDLKRWFSRNDRF